MTCAAGTGHPGQYRLALGKCYVGALARSLSPHTVSNATTNRIANSKMAEIRNLKETVGGNGRNRSRIRRPHREAHQRRLKMNEDIVICAVDMQDANWALCETRRIAKFRCLVDMMHEKAIDIVCLTDLHGSVDERVGVDTRFMTCMIEEFLFIQCGVVGFFMTPATYKAMVGAATVWDGDGRVATVDLMIEGCQVRIGAAYVPPMGGGDRVSVLDCIATVHANTQADHSIIFGGDWNSHMGRDGVEGRQAMLSPTSAGGRQLQKYLATKYRGKYMVADQKLVLRNRGTWCNFGTWYELDFFLVSCGYVGRCSKLQAVVMGESDHAAKIVNFRIANGTITKSTWRSKGHMVSKGYDVSKLNNEDVEEKYAAKMDEEITEELSWKETTAKIREVAAEVLGSRPKAGPNPMPSKEASELKKIKVSFL